MKIHLLGKNEWVENLDNTYVEIPSSEELASIVKEQAEAVTKIFTNEVTIPPTMKKCSRCKKMGRVGLYPVEDFSLLKNGKRHSQCKVCRTEQVRVWSEKKKDYRKEYHKQYREKHREELKAYAIKYRNDRYEKIRNTPYNPKIKRTDAMVVIGKRPKAEQPRTGTMATFISEGSEAQEFTLKVEGSANELS